MFQETKELTITSAPRTGKFHDLAEAIRLGCAMRPTQGFGKFLYGDEKACALGAALVARIDAAVPVPAKRRLELLRLFPVLEEFVEYPTDRIFTQSGPFKLWQVITGLNDHEHWTRERIADFLDTL